MNERIVLNKPGRLDVLEVVREAEPVPLEGQVKVRILAAGAAFGDVLLRRGVGRTASGYPVTPGYDFAGVVAENGVGSAKYAVGEQVAGLPLTGGYQQFICVAEDDLIPVPQDLEPNHIVSVILNYTTAYQLLTRAVHLKPGDAALFHGAAGGVGTAMLQLAGLSGVKLYGTVSGGKMDTVRRFGGIPIDYRRTDFVQELRRLEPDGVRAVFDPVGGAQLNRSYRVLGKKGTLVLLGASSAVQGGRPGRALVSTGFRFLGLKLRPGSRRVTSYLIEPARKKHPEHFREDVQTLLELLREGKIDPQIAEVLPLREARRAHELLEGAKVTGKIILQP